MPEILAPVGNEAMLEAALCAGADAVYLGTDAFNARRNAENFRQEDLAPLTARCHVRGVKVYLTLNILIRDDEMEAARDLAYAAYRAGVDGLIVADMGLAMLLHRDLPALPLHASTQMTVYAPGALPVLKGLGITRVVAAREMNRTQLKELTQAAAALGMEVEVFVHGALCMSVSGQCLLSAVLGGRSGNRGLCAGPCRLPFRAGNDNGYALSLKDLSLLPYLSEMASFGVASFKIEGRMKRPEYVAAATLAARQALTGEGPSELPRLLRQIFSRSGFTDGYYIGKRDASLFGMRRKEDSADAAAAQKALHAYYRREPAILPVTAAVTVYAGQPVRLTLDDGTHRVCVEGDCPEPAVTRELDEAVLRRSLSKLGGTPYYLNGWKALISPGYTLSASAVSTLKQRAVAALNAARSQTPPPLELPDLPPVARPKKPESDALWILRVFDKTQIPPDLTGAAAVVLPAERLKNPITLPNATLLWAELPRVCGEPALHRYLETAVRCGCHGVVCGNPAQLAPAKQAGLTPYAGLGMNLFSSYALTWAKEAGYAGGLLSVELRITQMPRIQAFPTAVFAYGRLPLMVPGVCPRRQTASCDGCDGAYALTDRKGIRFPVVCRGETCEMLNSVPVWLCDQAKKLPVDALVVYCTDESPERVREIWDTARRHAAFHGPYTRGLAVKGVL